MHCYGKKLNFWGKRPFSRPYSLCFRPRFQNSGSATVQSSELFDSILSHSPAAYYAVEACHYLSFYAGRRNAAWSSVLTYYMKVRLMAVTDTLWPSQADGQVAAACTSDIFPHGNLPARTFLRTNVHTPHISPPRCIGLTNAVSQKSRHKCGVIACNLLW